MADKFDLLVIGAGPGGYGAAIKAAQHGLKVMLVDKRANPGGTCLFEGCIPSKALLDASLYYDKGKNAFADMGIACKGLTVDLKKMQMYKDSVVSDLSKGLNGLIKKNKISYINGSAKFQSPGVVEVDNFASNTKETYTADNILIATGSSISTPANLKIDEKMIFTSTGLLECNKIPAHLLVIGAGYIGLELASVYLRLGSAVTIIELGDRIAPSMDEEISALLQQKLSDAGMLFRFNRKVIKITAHSNELLLNVVPSGPIDAVVPEVITSNAVLVATGRTPNTADLGLENIGIQLDPHGFIPINHLAATTCQGVYAIGDVTRGPMLAHRAQDQGIAFAERLAGQNVYVNEDVIPAVVYTHPEVASIGLSEQDVIREGLKYKVSKFSFAGNGRAKISKDLGVVKLIVDPATDKILGAHIIGNRAGDMISEVAICMEFGGSAEDIARTCHPHPSYSEALKEAAWGAFAKPLHS